MPSSFYDSAIGGHAVSATLETPTQRKARDLDARKGEWNVKTGTLAKGLDPVANLTNATTGRNDREFNSRGGDVTYVGKLLAPGAPKYDADGRNGRLYADPDSKVSAMTGDAWNVVAADAGA
jgi:hypothetical protein